MVKYKHKRGYRMEYKTIKVEGKDYYLVPKPEKQETPEGVEIRFKRTEKKTYFDIEVKGWFKKFDNNGLEQESWSLFRRIENEDGSFKWTDWSTGGVIPWVSHELVVESWYQNFINNNGRDGNRIIIKR